MCGLVGMAGKIYLNEKKVMKHLHFFDVTRGKDSTGLAVINDNGKVETYKAVGHVFNLWDAFPKVFDPKDYVINGFNIKAMIGHNRWSTVGASTMENAHPFTHGKISGAHNGTLDAYWLDKLDGSDMFEVDSEAIFYSLNKNGVKETIAQMSGAWALTWYDSEANTMNFIRNSKRPLHFVWSEGRDTLYWASEPWMLLAALSKEGVKHEEKIHTFLSDHHYYIELPKNGGSLKNSKLMYIEDEYKGFQVPVFKQNQQSYGNYFQNWWKENGVGSEEKDTTNLPVVKKGDSYEEIDKAFNAAKALVKKEVEFRIYGERISKINGNYFLADCAGLPNTWEIRLYGANHDRYDEWAEAGNAVEDVIYKGTIKSATSQWSKDSNRMERYLIMDLRTISEAVVEDKKTETLLKVVVDNTKKESTIVLEKDLEWNPTRLYHGFQRVPITFTEMMQAVNKGCVSCGEKIVPEEVDDIIFVQKGRLACSICSKDKVTMGFLGYKPDAKRG